MTLQYSTVRDLTTRLCEPLETEDFVVQTMADVSPTKWHLAHTTWFFETFILKERVEGYTPFDPAYEFLFNSYYNGVGAQFNRADRGLLSRPTVSEVFAYRRYVDDQMCALLEHDQSASLRALVELGLNHEQQHQELLVTDIKHVLAFNPMRPVYLERAVTQREPTPMGWWEFEAGVHEIGADADDGFCFDNETPKHRVYINEFALADRLVTNAEYLAFVQDGGYERSEFWLAAAWTTITQEAWTSPLYWALEGETWHEMTLSGFRRLEPSEPVCHVSYYEADAYARWANARLPTEAEWELAVSNHGEPDGNFLDPQVLYVLPGTNQLMGDVWEWTSSAYAPYPGYEPLSGTIGEYNGKFMVDQYVLRGGSCATAPGHVRRTYRNFFPSSARWQFSGIRLAKKL